MTAFPRRPLFVVVLSLAWAPAATAQPRPADAKPPPRSVSATGTDLFRGLLAFHGIVPVRAANVDHGKLIVIVHGLPRDRQVATVIADHVRRTLLAGGSVLIAVDEPTTFPGYFPGRTQIEVTREPISCANQERIFDGKESCPFVEPNQPSEVERTLASFGGGSLGPEWSLFAGRTRVATNMPRSIRVASRSRYVLANLAGFPAGTTTANAPLPNGRPFAIGGTGDKDQPFRSLVLADPGVFSNQMIAAKDTDNLLFASGVVEWLQGPEKDRGDCLFFEYGEQKSDFPDLLRSVEVPPVTPPIPPLPSPLDPELQRRLMEMADRGVANLDDENVLDKMFGGGRRDDRRYGRTLETIAGIVCGFALLLLIRRWWTGKHEPDLPPLPKDTGRVAASGPPGSLGRRREEILQAGNYTDLVREYLREMFAARGLVFAAGGEPPGAMPDVEVTGRDAKAVRGNLRILWDVAFAPKPRPISYSRWKELEPMLEAVRHAADEGRWRFAPGGRA